MALHHDHRRMSVEEFLAWHEKQPEKWELVDGEPVRRSRTRGMAGGSRRHGQIASNIIVALKTRLRGGPCAPLTSDVRIRTAQGDVRYPDVTVDCGRADARAMEAVEPRALFEVLSPSNSLRDQLRLLEEYQGIAAVRHIVFVAQDKPEALIWTRNAEAWVRTEAVGLEAEITLPALDCALPLAEVYEDAPFEEPPPPPDA